LGSKSTSGIVGAASIILGETRANAINPQISTELSRAAFLGDLPIGRPGCTNSGALHLYVPTILRSQSGSVGLQPEGGLLLASEGVTGRLLPDALVIETAAGASLSLTDEAKLDGTKILLNSPARASGEPPPEAEPPTIIELCDQDGLPVAGQRFRIRLPDGSERSDVLDDRGRATVDLPADAVVDFPGMKEVEPR